MSTYTVLLDLKTHVDSEAEDFWVDLKFVPQLGINIWLDEETNVMPAEHAGGAWFKVEDVDYQLKDDVFIVALKAQGDYQLQE